MSKAVKIIGIILSVLFLLERASFLIQSITYYNGPLYVCMHLILILIAVYSIIHLCKGKCNKWLSVLWTIWFLYAALPYIRSFPSYTTWMVEADSIDMVAFAIIFLLRALIMFLTPAYLAWVMYPKER